MVEVFKTNVIDTEDAQRIIDHIHKDCSHYIANFALDDCDKILRVKCLDELVSAVQIIAIVAAHGFDAAILPDDFRPSITTNFYFGFRKKHADLFN